MRLGTRILLLMLAITLGSSAVVSWIVTMSVTRFETDSADAQISLAIARYGRDLDMRHQQISRIIRAILEAPEQRSLIEAADDTSDPAAKEQLKDEVLGRDVQTELRSPSGTPAFHVLVNAAGEVVVTSVADPASAGIPFDRIHWPVDQTLGRDTAPVRQYIATSAGLYLAMGVPLRTQLSQPPSDAYFVGFRVDDDWVRRQLLADRVGAEANVAPLLAWFEVDGRVVARGASDVSDPRLKAFHSDAVPVRTGSRDAAPGSAIAHVQFRDSGERFVGQSFGLNPVGASEGRLVLASSLDQALLPLRRLQRRILLVTLIACAVAVVLCRMIARMISRPIQDLVDGTRRIAEGRFDEPVRAARKDELGTLADSFNQMAAGLKERDSLREERVKMERDLAVARKIQMDVLPRELPPCPGYDMAALSVPAEQTGGDIYDLVGLALDPPTPGDPSSLVLLLADATGHGIGPALSVTQVRSMLRIGVRLRAALDDIFSQINRQLCQDLGAERFVTAFLGLLDTASHHIDYRSAGQGPLLHFHAETHRFEWLDSSTLPLGIDAEAEGDAPMSMKVAPGDLIVLLTDGFYECQDAAKNQFGKERVAEIILQHHHRSARELLNELMRATRQFADGAPQLDDMTGLIIKRLTLD